MLDLFIVLYMGGFFIAILGGYQVEFSANFLMGYLCVYFMIDSAINIKDKYKTNKKVDKVKKV